MLAAILQIRPHLLAPLDLGAPPVPPVWVMALALGLLLQI